MVWLRQRSRVGRSTSALLVVAAALLTFFGVSATEGGAAAAGGTSPLGVYTGYQSPGVVDSFGRSLGQSPTFAMDFLDGDSWSALVNTAPSYMAAWKGSGYTMVWAIPMLPNASNGGGYSLAQGATGAYNSYFLQLAEDMVAGGQASSIIRPGWEFNGGWFSWAAGGQAAAFVGYWQQIVTTMRSVAGENFQFEWNPTAGDTGIGNLANYYPGNAYVDDIGLDVYDEGWGTYPGSAAEWNSIVTEPYGLNWLASFAAAQGKPITFPEWGLGWGPPNDGGVLSDPNNSVGGGDDPAFINDMAQWIQQHNAYDATFWQFGSSYLSPSSNPNSYAAFVKDFGAASLAASASGSTTTTTAAATTTTTSPGSTGTGSATGGDEGAGGSGTSSSGGAYSPSLPTQGGQTDSTVSLSGPTTPVPSARGARFSAVVTAVASGATSPTGTATWSITSASGASVACRSGSAVIRRGSGMTRCNVAPGAFRAADGPYKVSVSYPGTSAVAASSASLTQSVSKGNSRIRIRTIGSVPVGGSAVISAAVLGLPVAAGSPTGTVTFAVVDASGQSLSCASGDTVPLVSAVATCDTTPATAATAGSHYVVTATYSGDGTFTASTSNSRAIRVR